MYFLLHCGGAQMLKEMHRTFKLFDCKIYNYINIRFSIGFKDIFLYIFICQ